MTVIEVIIEQIEAARRYSKELIAHVPPGDWFRMPHEGVTHIAWQVGHVAMAEYRLALERIRGIQPGDTALIGESFLKLFGGGSVPNPDPSSYPSVDEIVAVLDRVHARTLEELTNITESDLDAPPHRPHPLFTTKRGSLLWCARHEMLHAGQIGLLRRLLGHDALW